MKKFGVVRQWGMAKRSVVVMFLFVGGISICFGGCEDTDRIDRLIAQKGELRSDVSSLRGQLYDSKLLVDELMNSKAELQSNIQKLETNIKGLDGKINELEGRKNRVVKDNEVLMDQVQGLKSEKNRLIIERNKLIAELAYEESKVLKSVVVGDLNLREKSKQTYSFAIPQNAKDVVFTGNAESKYFFKVYLFSERNFLLWKANEKSTALWIWARFQADIEKYLPLGKDVYYLVIIAPARIILLDPEFLSINVKSHVRYRVEE